MADIIRRMVEFVTGDASKPEARSKAPEVPMLAHYLGYRAFDPKRELFYLTRSKGFILELSPLIGADERIGDILNTVFSDILVSGTHYTVTNWPSPRVSEKLEGWVLPRVRAGGVFEKLARYRLDLLRNGAWAPLATDGPFHLRNFRVIFSVGMPDSAGVSLDDLTTMRQSVIAALDSINVAAKALQPVDLIRLIDDILCPSTGAGDDAPEYSALDPINEQCVRRDLVTLVQKDRLLLHAHAGVAEDVEDRTDCQLDGGACHVRIGHLGRGRFIHDAELGHLAGLDEGLIVGGGAVALGCTVDTVVEKQGGRARTSLGFMATQKTQELLTGIGRPAAAILGARRSPRLPVVTGES